MPATMEERLDELLGMSRETGRLACEVERWEKDAEYSAQSWRGKNGRHFLRKTRKELEAATAAVERARSRFLAALPAEESAS